MTSNDMSYNAILGDCVVEVKRKRPASRVPARLALGSWDLIRGLVGTRLVLSRSVWNYRSDRR